MCVNIKKQLSFEIFTQNLSTTLYTLHVYTFYMYLLTICIYTNICMIYGAKPLIEFAIHIL